MSDTPKVLKAPADGRYDRGWCEPNPQKAKQCVDRNLRVPQKPQAKPTQGDRFVRDLNPPISKRLQKLMKNPAWQAMQVEKLRAEMKDDSPTVGKFFENMVKIASIPFTVFGAGCRFNPEGIVPDCDASPCDVDARPQSDTGVDPDSAVDGDLPDSTVPVDSTVPTDADAAVVVDDRPTITWPNLVSLPNNRAFLKWDAPLETEPGKTIVGYQVSWSDAGNDYTKDVTSQFTAIDILSPNTMHRISVRARYDDATYGQESQEVQVVTDSSLVARYTMDEGSGGMTMDSFGTNDGTLVGFDPTSNYAAAWTPGVSGSALLFDGVSTYVDMGDRFNFDSTDAFTIEAWNSRAMVGAYHALVAKYGDSGGNIYRGYWFGYTDTDEIGFDLASDWDGGDLLSSRTAQQYSMPNSSRHIAVSYDGSMTASGVMIYVDGVSQVLVDMHDQLFGTTVNASVSSRIGASSSNTLYSMSGPIDDVAIYEGVAHSPAVIVQNGCASKALGKEQAGDPVPPAECP